MCIFVHGVGAQWKLGGRSHRSEYTAAFFDFMLHTVAFVAWDVSGLRESPPAAVENRQRTEGVRAFVAWDVSGLRESPPAAVENRQSTEGVPNRTPHGEWENL